MPSSRAAAMCWAETSASVQWVATRTERTPRSQARLRSCDRADARAGCSVVRRACVMFAAATSIHSQSVWLPGP